MTEARLQTAGFIFCSFMERGFTQLHASMQVSFEGPVYSCSPNISSDNFALTFMFYLS